MLQIEEGTLVVNFIMSFLLSETMALDIEFELLEERMLASGLSICEVAWLKMVSMPRLFISICCPITPLRLIWFKSAILIFGVSIYVDVPFEIWAVATTECVSIYFF